MFSRKKQKLLAFLEWRRSNNVPGVGHGKECCLGKLPSDMLILMKLGVLFQLRFFKNFKQERQQFKVLY